MAFQLNPAKSLRRELRRALDEQIGAAIGQLEREGPLETRVHETRKALKRARALLRLVAPSALRERILKIDGQLADAARLLSGTRDAHVMMKTLAFIEARESAGPSPPSRRSAARSRARSSVRPRATAGAGIAALRAALRQQVSADGAETTAAVIHQALKALRRSRRHARQAIPDAPARQILVPGLTAAFEKGRRLARRALEEGGDELLHDLRKAVQLHWRHVGLFLMASPRLFAARHEEARELARLLGDHNDLAVLIAFIEAGTVCDTDARAAARLIASCREAQAVLAAEALPRAALLFAEPSSSLVASIAASWRTQKRLRARTPRRAETVVPLRVGVASPEKR